MKALFIILFSLSIISNISAQDRYHCYQIASVDKKDNSTIQKCDFDILFYENKIKIPNDGIYHIVRKNIYDSKNVITVNIFTKKHLINIVHHYNNKKLLSIELTVIKNKKYTIYYLTV